MKIKITALAMAALLVICAGCSDSKPANANGAKSGNMQTGNQRQQTFVFVSDEVKQAATKVITGTVESIVGNEITLLIASETEGAQSRQDNQSETADNQQMSGGLDGERTKRAEGERPQRSEGMTMPDGSMPQRRQRTEKSEAAESDGTSLAEKSADTAKTAKYLLPVGMSMGSKDYSSVTAGNTLKIYFGIHPQDGSEMITAVEVVSGRR